MQVYGDLEDTGQISRFNIFPINYIFHFKQVGSKYQKNFTGFDTIKEFKKFYSFMIQMDFYFILKFIGNFFFLVKLAQIFFSTNPSRCPDKISELGEMFFK